MFKIKSETKTLICIGSGGVGKTTLAATLALGQAREGKSVLVLTIDPSLRLAQALGFKLDGKTHDITPASIQKSGGKISATVLQHEQIFENFITAAAKHHGAQADIQKLLKSKLYKQLSTSLSGSQEFTALYQLQQFVSSGKYDLVVLDTPPAQHTWQFLRSPERIAQLFNDHISKWFRVANLSGSTSKAPGILSRVLSGGASQVLNILKMLTGSEFLTELRVFFEAIEKWQPALEKQVLDCHRLLTAATTEFVLVTTLDPYRLNESDALSRQIELEGYHLTSLIVNRTPVLLSEDKSSLSKPFKQLYDYYSSLEKRAATIQKKLTHLALYKCAEVSQDNLDANNLLSHYEDIELFKSSHS